jgi:hypothetical protein
MLVGGSKRRSGAPEMLEVVVVTRLEIKDVNNDVTVIKGDPFSRRPTLHVSGFDPECPVDASFNLLGNRTDLPVVSPRSDDEGVKGIHEFAQVQDHRIDAELLVGTFDDGVDYRRDKSILRAADRAAAGRDRAQRATPRTTTATTKGTLTALTPMMA